MRSLPPKTHRLVSVLAAAAALAASACTGDDPSVVGPGGEAAEPPPDGGLAPSVGCPPGCTAKAPTGWTGPIALGAFTDAQTAPTCAEPYPTEALAANEGLVEEPASCSSCDGATASNAGCDYQLAEHNGSGCQGAPSTNSYRAGPNVPSNDCSDVAENSAKSVKVMSMVSTTTCTAAAQTPTKPPARWTRRVRGCASPSLSACGDNPLCATAPIAPASFNRLCVFREGDVGCPSEDYPVKVTTFKGATDDRSCSPCTAQPVDACKSDPQLTFHSNVSCNNPLSTRNNLAVGVCFSVAQSRYFTIQSAQGACTTGGGAPTGSITPKDPVTVCCQP